MCATQYTDALLRGTDGAEEYASDENGDEQKDAEKAGPDEKGAAFAVRVSNTFANAEAEQNERRSGDADGKSPLSEAGEHGNGKAGGDACEQGCKQRDEGLKGSKGRVGRNGSGV